MSDGPAKLGEFQRIARYFRPLSDGFAGAFNLTDDAAAFDIPSTHELVTTVDAMVENAHFLRADGPQSIAQRLLRSNLSDLAAMGAEPLPICSSLPCPMMWTRTGWKFLRKPLGADQKNTAGI